MIAHARRRCSPPPRPSSSRLRRTPRSTRSRRSRLSRACTARSRPPGCSGHKTQERKGEGTLAGRARAARAAHARAQRVEQTRRGGLVGRFVIKIEGGRLDLLHRLRALAYLGRRVGAAVLRLVVCAGARNCPQLRGVVLLGRRGTRGDSAATRLDPIWARSRPKTACARSAGPVPRVRSRMVSHGVDDGSIIVVVRLGAVQPTPAVLGARGSRREQHRVARQARRRLLHHAGR